MDILTTPVLGWIFLIESVAALLWSVAKKN